jgi:thiol-disulfide isomerase/thioredoxin
LRAANARGKLLLVDFYGAWCPWCIKMDQTLANPQVKKLLGARFHYFKLDVGRFDQHPGCLRQYGVTSIPYLLVFNPEGRVRASGVGYQTPTDFLAFLNRAVVKPVDFGNRKGWQVVRMDSQEVAREDGRGTNVLDGDGNSIWHTEWSARSPQPPHEIVIDLGQSRKVAGVRYLPRQGHPNGRIQEYEFFVSNSPENLGPPVAQGSFPNEGTEKRVRFKTSQQGRYIGLRALSEVNRQPWTSVAELGILSD